MTLARKLVLAASLVLTAACSSSSAPPSVGSVGVFADVASLQNDGRLAYVTAVVTDVAGNPGTGSVAFTASAGNLNATGTTTATAALDVNGRATVSYACDAAVDAVRCGAGTVLITAVWSSVTNGTRITLQGAAVPGADGGSSNPDGGTTDAGPVVGPVGPPVAILETGVFPALLGLKGSGIQETGVMTFFLSDASARGVSGVTVTFGQTQPALVTLAQTSGVTAADGTVSVAYSAGPEVGVTSITATVGTTGIAASHSIAVRGAKPSASGFYFRCEKGNLPAYQTTPALETMTCEVRLSDRFGNRVGISTPVRFATEAGAIDAVVLTKPFDPANPNDPAEGTATVTFSTDMGNGFRPADVDPLLAAPAQYPWPRQAEPQVLVGSVKRNPRDQLVTLIAMTDGEEAFVDANHNGTLDNNEVFYDLGDPFIDANDDGLYDQVYTGGPWEVRFCRDMTNCASYNGPNGAWDSFTTIWVPTWVVFSDNAGPSTAPAGQAEPALSFAPTCVPEKASGFADIYVYDEFLNSPPAGTTYTDPPAVDFVRGGGTITPTKHGLFEEPDNWGAMGKLGLDFDYWPVLPAGTACAAPASPTAPTACVLRLFFRDFDDGFRGTIEAKNTSAGGATCGATGTNPLFGTSIGAINVRGLTMFGGQVGEYAP